MKYMMLVLMFAFSLMALADTKELYKAGQNFTAGNFLETHYESGAGTASVYVADKSTIAKCEDIVGVAEQGAGTAGQNVQVIQSGKLKGVYVNMNAFIGEARYLGAAGELTSTKPTSPDKCCFIAKVHDADTLQVFEAKSCN